MFCMSCLPNAFERNGAPEVVEEVVASLAPVALERRSKRVKLVACVVGCVHALVDLVERDESYVRA